MLSIVHLIYDGVYQGNSLLILRDRCSYDRAQDADVLAQPLAKTFEEDPQFPVRPWKEVPNTRKSVTRLFVRNYPDIAMCKCDFTPELTYTCRPTTIYTAIFFNKKSAIAIADGHILHPSSPYSPS